MVVNKSMESKILLLTLLFISLPTLALARGGGTYGDGNFIGFIVITALIVGIIYKLLNLLIITPIKRIYKKYYFYKLRKDTKWKQELRAKRQPTKKVISNAKITKTNIKF